MPAFEIICLANSRKIGGRCVAGLTRSGEWIRPVSVDADGTLYRQNYLLDSGTEAAVLDMISVSVGKHTAELHQPENWQVTNAKWEYVGKLSGDAAGEFLRDHAIIGPEILGNQSDRVSWDRLQESPGAASLALVEPRDLRWYITTSMRGNRQTRALFGLGAAAYDLSVTDPVWETRLRELPTGVHPLSAAGLSGNETLFLTISLSEPFQGSCFKLVAAVIALP